MSFDLGDPSSDIDLLQAVIDHLAITQVRIYVATAAFALLLYDSLITLPDEVELIWGRKPLRTISALYVTARISTLLLLGLNLLSTLGIPVIVRLLSGVAVDALLFARVYALSREKRWSCVWIGIVFIAFLIAFSMQVVKFPFISTQCQPDVGVNSVALVRSIAPSDLAGNLSGTVLEALIIAMTAAYTWKAYKETRSFKFASNNKSLIKLFVEQGVIRFLFTFLWGVELTIGTQVLPGPLVAIDVPLQNAVSTILICRFTLQLRKWNASPSKAITTTKEDDSRFFQMFLGRLDAQITQDFRNPLSGDQGISSEPEDEDEVFWGNNPLYVSTEDYPWVDKSV